MNRLSELIDRVLHAPVEQLALAGGAIVVALVIIAAIVRRVRARPALPPPALRPAPRGVALRRAVVAVVPLVEQVVERMRDRFVARGFELVVESGEPALRVSADAPRLDQALTFLLDNTLQHANPPGPVRVSARRSGNYASIAVADAGPGVPKMALLRIFDRDYRTDVARTRVAGDHRLGLSICRMIVEAHGGSIEANPSEQGGLRIEILLPIAR